MQLPGVDASLPISGGMLGDKDAVGCPTLEDGGTGLGIWQRCLALGV